MLSANNLARRGSACLAVMVMLGPFPAAADVLPHGLKIEKVLGNAAELGDLAQSPTGELWLLERVTGTIRLFFAGVERSSLTLPVQSVCDSGLLDVAFAPDYAASGQARVSYVSPTGELVVS